MRTEYKMMVSLRSDEMWAICHPHTDGSFENYSFTAPLTGIYEMVIWSDKIMIVTNDKINKTWRVDATPPRNTGVNSQPYTVPKGGYYQTPFGVQYIPDGATVNPATLRNQSNNNWGDDGGNSWGFSPWVYFSPDNPHDEQMYKPQTKCECGTEKVYGNSVNESNHSDYCPVYQRWMNESKK
jgi:hypothetical protein